MITTNTKKIYLTAIELKRAIVDYIHNVTGNEELADYINGGNPAMNWGKLELNSATAHRFVITLDREFAEDMTISLTNN